MSAIATTDRPALGALLSESRRLVETGEAKKALELAEKAHGIASSEGNDLAIAQSLVCQGFSYLRLAAYPKAIAALEKSRAAYLELHHGPGQIDSLCLLGRTYVELGNYDSALGYFQAAKELLKNNSDSQSEIQLCLQLGSLYNRMRDYEEAERFFNRALTICRDRNDPWQMARALNGLALALMGFNPRIGSATAEKRPRCQEAVRRLQEALDYAIDANDPHLCMNLRGNLGLAHSALGESAEALTRYSELLVVARERQQPFNEVLALGNIGEVHLHLGRPEEAISHFNQAWTIAEKLGSKRELAALSVSLSRAFEAKGDAAAAFQYYRRYHTIETEVLTDEAKRKADMLVVGFELERQQREMDFHRRYGEELRQANEKLSQQAALLERQSREDGLTGIANRRQLEQALAATFARSANEHKSLAVAMIDVDHFKRYNDTYSHATGDRVLRQVANILRDHCRAQDWVARYGGDEFAVVFDSTTAAVAWHICERIRTAVQMYDWSRFLPDEQVSISVGLADSVSLADHEKLLASADRALYRAKELGRNRVYCEQK